MRIYVARHGQTQWNAENKVCGGKIDIPLSAIGEQQAQELAQEAVKHPIDVIISSTMIRAKQTAQAVADAMGLEVVTDARLVEQDYGIYDGEDRKDPGFLANKKHFAYRYPGGESMLQLAHRLYSFLDEIRLTYAGKNVLLVCHGGVARSLRTYFVDMTNEEYFLYSPGNASLEAYDLAD